VPHSICDPTFHKWKATKVPEPLDPCCTSCREPDSALTVVVYVPDESYLPALEFVLTNAAELGGDPGLRVDRTYKFTGLSIVRSGPEGDWATGFSAQKACLRAR
jgi:hypothetical protein